MKFLVWQLLAEKQLTERHLADIAILTTTAEAKFVKFARTLYFKTFSVSNLQMFVIS